MHQHRILEDTVYFWFGSNDTSGSGDDGAGPVWDVRLAGAAAGAIPVLSGAATLLTHANYPDGSHEIAIAATAANGFSAGNTYAVFCSLTVDGQTPTGFVGSFSLEPIIADLREMGGVEQSATDLKDFADAGYDPGTNKVQGVVLVDTCTTLTGHTAQTGDNFARLGAPAGASVSADILENQTDLNTIITDTNELQTDWTNGGRLDLIIDAIKAVTDLIPDAGALNDLATILSRIGTPANIDTGGATIADNIKKIADDNGGVNFDATTDSLERLANTAPIGTAMRGTDSAALASVCTEARLSELAAANIPADIDTLLTRVPAAVALASVCTEARLAELDAANLPADVDTLLTRITAAVALASVCTEARLAELDAANLPADIAGLNDISVADVNAQVADVINTDANVELATVPTTVSPLRQQVQFIFQYFRNKKTITSTTETLMKEDAATTLGTATLTDDGTTFTKGEM
jgi:hypothetical protein